MPRFTFDIIELLDGVGLIPVAMGLFGISEVLLNIEVTLEREVFTSKVMGIFPTLADWRRSIGAILRGTGIGFFLGLLPGGGAILASFVSYAVEKRVSRYPERFGTGVIEGVAAPESANNAGAQASFIPLLTLGIPSNIVMAMLLGALMIHGVTPGPLLLVQHPDIFLGLVASMYVGNAMLLLLNLPLIGLWVKLLRVPYSLLFPLILFFCLTGAYSINNSFTDVVIMLIFGGIGYVMRKLSLEAAPLVLAFVIGPLMENALRLSLIKSNGNFAIFLTRPISAVCLAVAFALLAIAFFPRLRRSGVPVEKEQI
jgi:putative tricarboxylic transport membrane protein